jgi:hypothetical protein
MNVLKFIFEVDLHQRGDHTVRFFRSDGGSEFQNAKMDTLLRMHDIAREQTCRGTSFQVGKPERMIGVIFAGIRTLLFDSKMPTVFWAEAFATKIYLYNRTPGADGKSPFERRYGKPPKIKHLRPFGAGCAINIPTGDRKGTIVAATVPGIMVGYGYVEGKKGYRVYVPSTRKVITAYNVTFNSLSASLHERKLSNTHLVASSDETAAMLDEFHPASLTRADDVLI